MRLVDRAGNQPSEALRTAHAPHPLTVGGIDLQSQCHHNTHPRTQRHLLTLQTPGPIPTLQSVPPSRVTAFLTDSPMVHKPQ